MNKQNNTELKQGCGKEFNLNVFQKWICGEEHGYNFEPKYFLCPECKEEVLKNE